MTSLLDVYIYLADWKFSEFQRTIDVETKVSQYIIIVIL